MTQVADIPGSTITESGGELLTPSLAVFSADRRYRYLLTRTWGDRQPTVFVMLNPSTAGAVAVDPTIARCARRAAALGAGGIEVVNLFAWRATSPAGLYAQPDPVGPLNDHFIREACGEPGRTVIVAWGLHGGLHGRAQAVAAMLSGEGIALSCLDITKGGQPRHSLYVPANRRLVSYPPAGTPGSSGVPPGSATTTPA